jgi:hypothetical protein
VYVNHVINTSLDRVTRQEAIRKGLEVSRAVRELGRREERDSPGPGFANSYRQAQLLCPLNELGECLIFEDRPVACRLFDLAPQGREELSNILPGALDRLSDAVYEAFTSRSFGKTSLSFLLPEVVSGRFVQAFFHHLLQNSVHDPHLAG